MSDNKTIENQSIKKGSISDVFIMRPAMTILLALSSLLFGIYCYKAMPVNDLPGVDYPVIQVTVSYPGADPEIMASNVASPLEQQFMQIPGVEMITSSNAFGASSLVLQFNMEKSIDAAANDVQAAIQRATGNLPQDLPAPPSFSKDNPNDVPIIILSVISDSMTDGALYEFAFSEIAQKISMIEGVSKVQLFGSPRAVRVQADMNKLYSLGVSMTDLRTALSRTTNMIGAGQVEGPSNLFVLQPKTQLDYAIDYQNIVVSYRGGIPVYLRDVANIIDAPQADTLKKNFWISTVPKYNDKTDAYAILMVRKTAAGNAITTVKAIEEKIAEINRQLPPSVKVATVYDRSALIVDNIKDVEETILIAFCLVVLVIFLFLGRIRDTLIPAIALPFSLVLTFIFMHAFGFSLNNLSLMGLTMAIGFLVDDAIVFLENTVRRMEDFHETPLQAAFASAKEISFTILSMTLSLAAVFIPLVFMSGIVGRVFQEFSVTIIIATLMSGLVSLTITPLMCARLLKSRKSKEDRTLIEGMAHKLEGAFLKFYSPTLSWFLRRPLIALAILAACIYGTFHFFTTLKSEMFPVGDSGFGMGFFLAPTKTSPAEMAKLQQSIYDIVKQDPNVKNVFAITGVPGFLQSNSGIVGVMLKDDKKARLPINEVANSLSGKVMMAVPGVIFAVSPQPTLKVSTGAVSTKGGKYQYTLTSMEQDDLFKAAGQLISKLKEREGKLFVRVTSFEMFLDNPQVQLVMDREKASMLGVSAETFAASFRDTYAKFYYYLIKSTFNQYWSVLEAEPQQRAFLDGLDNLYFSPDAAVTGGSPIRPFADDANAAAESPYSISSLIPFSAIGKAVPTVGPISISHTNNFPSVTISFDLVEGVAISEAMDFVNTQAAGILPANVDGRFVGEAVSFSSTMYSLLVLMFVAFFVMYVILGILYESYTHPVTVLIALPTAIVGGLATIYFLDMRLSVYSAIGVFMLMGIVKKNGILVVDFAIARQKEGQTPIDAIHHACMDRFRPIIMTTLAALMGMLPIALGWGKADAESRIPLGMVVVGGLIFSQLITLYVTPVVYLWMEWIQENVLDKIGFFKRTEI